jgi:hypothetical protein
MGYFKKEDEALRGQSRQRLAELRREFGELGAQEYDHNVSTKHQLRDIREHLKELRMDGRDTYVFPIKAWDEIINYIKTLLEQDRYQECSEGTVGCTTRHKHHDHCSDDPRYSN